MNEFLDNLYRDSGMLEIQVRRTREKVEERIQCFRESYEKAKAKVQDVCCAGPGVWAVIDREYNAGA